MNFIALLEQTKWECDGYIDCGKKWVTLSAKSVDEAMAQLKEIILGKPDDDYSTGFEGGYWEDRKLSGVTFMLVDIEYEVPLGDWYAEGYANIAQRAKENIEKKEREEYEKLKAKFEK